MSVAQASIVGQGRLERPCSSSSRASSRRISRRAPGRALVARAVVDSQPEAQQVATLDINQCSREGSYEAPLVDLQAGKADGEQPSISSVLPPADPASVADVAVVGSGPAGLALAAELGKQGLRVALISKESKFVNNYGVWLDEFKALGLEHTLDATWKDAICYFKEGKEVRVGRGYGRVCRRSLRQHFLQACATAGVTFLEGEVTAVDTAAAASAIAGSTAAAAPSAAGAANLAAAKPPAAAALPTVRTAEGRSLSARLVVLASGAAAGRLLRYEDGAPAVAAQTAYGIEAEVEGYDQAYDPTAMLFMDFRRHHTGLYDGGARRLQPAMHPNGGDGLWGSEGETPSFLYAMPLGGNRVFLEETCLVARPALPFATLKRRLLRRCDALGINVKEIHEEEWSYIPVGGPLPTPDQPLVAFGAAANLIHPATGYSLARSLREAPGMAKAIRQALQEQPDSAAAARFVWEVLWTQEKRRQASFHVFGMELLCQLDVASTGDFFTTFFRLPRRYWQGFLASQLSSVDLLSFALATFALAPWGIKARLVAHLVTDPAGQYLMKTYMGQNREQWEVAEGTVAAAGVLASAAAAMALLQAAAERA